jgi:very-short-patch-repair endonuclease
VVVELDGWAAHSSRAAMVADRRRDRALRIAGWQPSRISWDDLDDEPRLVADLRALLLAPGAPRTGHRGA